MNKRSIPEKEQRLKQLIEECLDLMGERYRYQYIREIPDKQPHLQSWNILLCKKYAFPIEKRDLEDNIVRNLSDPKQKAEYDKSKEIEDKYEMIYLAILDAGLEEELRPTEPWRFFKERCDASGESAYIERLKELQSINPGNYKAMIQRFYGSEEAMMKSQRDFYQQKIKQLIDGE